MTTSRTVEDRALERRRRRPTPVSRMKSSIATSAAAPPPTALNSDTSCGIAVIFTVRAVYRPAPPPISEADDDDHPGACAAQALAAGRAGRRASPPTASDHARRRTAGCRCGPWPASSSGAGRGRSTAAPTSQAKLDERVDRGLGSIRPGPRSTSAGAAGLGRRLLAEHLEHPVGDDVAADDVHRREGHGHEASRLAQRVVGLGGDEHRTRRARCRGSSWRPTSAGVWSVAGTLLMTSKPTRIASTKRVSA